MFNATFLGMFFYQSLESEGPIITNTVHNLKGVLLASGVHRVPIQINLQFSTT